MVTRGPVCTVEGRTKKEDQGVGTPFRRKIRRHVCVQRLMWEDNFWLFSDDREVFFFLKEMLVCMVNDIIEELLGLDMGSKPESLWWTSTYKDEDVATLEVESRKKIWDLLFMEVFDVLDYRFQRDGGRGCNGRRKRSGKVGKLVA